MVARPSTFHFGEKETMKKYFITGLITLIPFSVTLWLVHFMINVLTKPFIGITTLATSHLPIDSPKAIHALSQLFILIFLFLFLWFLGFVARKFFFHQMIRIGDAILFKIPLVNKIYKTAKEIVVSLFSDQQKAFQQVVLLPFPYKGSYCIGLISRDAPPSSSGPQLNQVSVFIPTTPNPATGYMVMCDPSELIHLHMRPEEAIKYVVSCGVIQPGEANS